MMSLKSAGTNSWEAPLARSRGRRWVCHPVMIGQEVARIVVARRAFPFGQHRRVPGLPVVLEPVEDFLVSVLAVGPLARVSHHVEQELVAGNPQIFPVTIAYGALRSGLEAPEQL